MFIAIITAHFVPLETPFLAEAREGGNTIINGLDMLIHQGPPVWKRWLGVEPSVNDELHELMEQIIASG